MCVCVCGAILDDGPCIFRKFQSSFPKGCFICILSSVGLAVWKKKPLCYSNCAVMSCHCSFPLCRCLGKAVLCDCGISWVTPFIFDMVAASRNQLLHIPRFRTSVYENSFSVSAAQFWNTVTLAIRTSDNLASFKTSMRKILLDLGIPGNFPFLII